MIVGAKASDFVKVILTEGPMPENPVLNVMKQCDILFENELISKGLLISTFTDYVAELIDDAEKNSGIIYHTGSSIFDLLLTLYISLSCLLYDETTPEELVSSLNPGDIIIYKDKTRAEFLGLDENGFARIRYGSSKGKYYSPITATVAPNFFYTIKPYYGEATVLDGRGVRTDTEARIDFLQSVLGLSRAKIAGVNRRAGIVVCSRNFADNFVNKLQICYENNIIGITDLISVSYYSENNEYPYRGNPGKSNPVLKFTNKVSIARDFVYEDEDRQIFAIAVLGGPLIKNGESELPDLINKKSLKKKLMSLSITEEGDCLCETYPDASIFACTKDMLLSYSLPADISGFLNAEMESQVTNMLIREVIERDVDKIISFNDYKEFRQNIFTVRHLVQNDDLINRFVMESYSFLNYLTNVTFSLTEIEEARQNQKFECPSVSEKMHFLGSVAHKYTGKLSELILSIFHVIKKAYQGVNTGNPKKEPLLETLKSALQNGTVLILVPKLYHVSILKALLPLDINNAGNLHIKTMAAFKNKGNYDYVLFTGCLGARGFSIFSTFVAPVIECLLYPHERPLFTYQKKIHEKREHMLNIRSAIKYEITDELIGEQESDLDLMNTRELDDYLDEITIQNALQLTSIDSGGASVKADIVRIATTTEGESILFTKYFTPYIFDSNQMVVTESSVRDIKAGDMLLFTRNSDQKKDIIEEIVKRIADSNKQTKEAFRKSKHWKERLLEFKEVNNLSFQDLSELMKEYGTPKHAVTLRTWLNPESRIVAPREEDSFYQIALICEDQDMLASPEAFHEACNAIRKLRVKILKLIGQSIIKNFQSEFDETDFFSDIIREELDNLSQFVQIETIVDVANVLVPVTYANRPYAL